MKPEAGAITANPDIDPERAPKTVGLPVCSQVQSFYAPLTNCIYWSSTPRVAKIV
jgi:hypothetical protein